MVHCLIVSLYFSITMEVQGLGPHGLRRGQGLAPVTQHLQGGSPGRSQTCTGSHRPGRLFLNSGLIFPSPALATWHLKEPGLCLMFSSNGLTFINGLCKETLHHHS